MQQHPPRIKLTPEAAHYIGASKTFLEKARCAGDGPPFIRIGARKVGYLVEDLDKWLASRRRTSTSDLQGTGRGVGVGRPVIGPLTRRAETRTARRIEVEGEAGP